MIDPGPSDPATRYRLERDLQGLHGSGRCGFVMLNPSTADADQDDPTIRRCRDFATREGFARLTIANLYPYRATKPQDMRDHVGRLGWHPRIGDLPIAGDELDLQAWRETLEGDLTVVAWGATIDRPWLRESAAARIIAITDLAKKMGVTLYCLGKTRTGHPRHPLYVPGRQRFVPWDWERYAGMAHVLEGLDVSETLSPKHYAETRGVSRQAVMKAIQTGRLKASLSKNEKGWWRIDRAVADREWLEMTDPQKQEGGKAKAGGAPTKDPTPSMFDPGENAAKAARLTHAQASTDRIQVDAELKRLDLLERQGLLVDRRAVEREAYEMARVVRDCVLQVPERIAAELAGLKDPGELQRRLAEELAMALEGLTQEPDEVAA